MIADGWLRLRLLRLAPRVLIGSFVTGVVYTLVLASILDIFFSDERTAKILAEPYDQVFPLFISYMLISMLWSAAYLVYNYVRNYERQEIKNLKLEASKNEMELNNLRSQLNPHFMFNAMNSIRALINEDPELAKTAVTRFSNILRSTLVAGKKQVVSLREELAIVKDHVALEKIRYEERLNVYYDIDDDTMSIKVPPLIVQTLVENAIKHGISKIPDGGDLKLEIQREKGGVEIVIENSGQFRLNGHRDTGIGLENTRKRLDILYKDKASLRIKNKDEQTVRSVLFIPENH